VLHAAENGLRDPLGKRLLPSGKHTKNGKIPKIQHFWWVNQSSISMGHVPVRYVTHYQRVMINHDWRAIGFAGYHAQTTWPRLTTCRQSKRSPGPEPQPHSLVCDHGTRNKPFSIILYVTAIWPYIVYFLHPSIHSSDS
jgi:hypothetical protein